MAMTRDETIKYFMKAIEKAHGIGGGE